MGDNREIEERWRLVVPRRGGPSIATSWNLHFVFTQQQRISMDQTSSGAQ